MPLFGQKSSSAATIQATAAAPLTRTQTAFNNLIKKIEGRRAQLAEWETELPGLRQYFDQELVPVSQQLARLQGKLAQALDAAYDEKGVTKTERRKLSALILNLGEEALAAQEDEAVKAVVNRHSQGDYDAHRAAELAEMKRSLEAALGMELGDDVDISSPEDVLAEVERFMAAQGQGGAESGENAEGEGPWGAGSRGLGAEEVPPGDARASRREAARQARQEAEEKRLSQSVREVFRKLASALHPDREPDPEEKVRKTGLMQRANEAYEKGDLLRLLELQLELEHIDAGHLAGLSPDRLKQYVKILKGQLADLDQALEGVVHHVCVEFGLAHFLTLRPKDLKAMLLSDVENCRADLEDLQEKLSYATDPKVLKAWLKTVYL